jgi:hypothetical protein
MKVRSHLLSTAVLSCLLCPMASQAANWLELQGVEAPNAPALNVFGFVQAQHQVDTLRPAKGMVGALAPYNGQSAVFNLVAPDQTVGTQTQIFRARPGVRGIIPNTDGKINYFVLAEFGNNGLTRESRPVLSDASLTFNYIPGARVRLGQFKAPTGEEAMQGVNVMDYMNFSTVTDQLLNERFFSAHAPDGRSTNIPAGTVGADMVGAVSGFRDVGLQVFDWFKLGNRWEVGYAAMLSKGNGISWTDNDSNLDTTLRMQASYLLNPQSKGVKREDVMMYAWHQEGKRNFSGQNITRTREGYGLTYRQGDWRAGGEFIRGKGMIFNGHNPPFNDVGGAAAEPVATVSLADGLADGYALDAGYKVMSNTWLNLRYDIYHRNTQSSALQRDFDTWTTGVQYNFSPKLRLDVNYEFRKMFVPYANSLSGAALTNAQAIASSMADRWGMQLTWTY